MEMEFLVINTKGQGIYTDSKKTNQIIKHYRTITFFYGKIQLTRRRVSMMKY